MYIDTHAHLDFADFDPDRDALIEKAKNEGLEYIINVSSSLKGCRQGLDLAARYDMVYASIGIHPHDVKEIDEGVFKQLEDFIKSEKVVAIGEVGLDFYRNLSPADVQAESFIRFIKLSNQSGLPIIIHSRAAQEETLKILKNNSSGKLKGVVHCFSGGQKFLTGCLDLGLHISFTCNITYKKADDLRQLAKDTPLNKLLLETDCPYLAPQNLRGSRNEPLNVKYLAGALAQIRNCSVEEIAENTTENAKKLFGLK